MKMGSSVSEMTFWVLPGCPTLGESLWGSSFSSSFLLQDTCELETHASLVKPFLAGPQPQFGGGKTHRSQEATFNQMGQQGFAGGVGRESLGCWPGEG